MGEKIRQHIRSNVIGYVALFVALSGTAYAVDGPLPGQNQVGSQDIINGEVTNGDLAADAVASGKIADRQVKNADLSIGASSSNTIADGGVKGIDIDESSLGFECPAGYDLAGKDVCYEPEPASAAHFNNFNGALDTCADNGDRLPTLAEGWSVIADLPNPVDFGTQQTWTADQSSGTAEASTLTKNSAGTITRGSTDVDTDFPFRCVTSPHG